MKKLLSTILCLGLLSANLAGFAEASKKVEILVTPATLNSEQLRKECSAYNVTFVNNTNDTLMVQNVRGNNLVGMETMAKAFRTPSKKASWLLILSPFTLGLTGIIYSVKMLNNINPAQDRISEGMKYSINKTMAAGTLLTPKQVMQVPVLVPLNQTPEISAVFLNMQTKEYIGVDNLK